MEGIARAGAGAVQEVMVGTVVLALMAAEWGRALAVAVAAVAVFLHLFVASLAVLERLLLAAGALVFSGKGRQDRVAFTAVEEVAAGGVGRLGV